MADGRPIRHNQEIAELVDIHCHILPGIDDGPRDLAESVEMARAAVASGLSTVVATPHLRPDFPMVKVDEIAERCDDLMTALRYEGIGLTVVPGGEVSLAWALGANETSLRLASYGQRGTDILIETPNVGGPMLPVMLRQVMATGYRVVLAHPERLDDFRRDPSLLEQLSADGIIFQFNADSLVANARKSTVAKLAQDACTSGLTAVIASDGHRGALWRPVTRLAEARAAVSRRLGETPASVLCELAPSAVLSGDAIPSVDRISQVPSRHWFRSRRLN